MKIRLISALLAGTFTAALAAADATKAQPGTALPTVEDAIPGPVKALGKPALVNFPGGIRIAVSTATEEAQVRVNQGLNHLHGGWEFEASRNFAMAMREDPDCLLAHWGMVMSLLNPSAETGAARNAATDRLLHLIDRGQGTDLERGYAYGLIKYIEEGPAGAATAFRRVAEKFPNEMQAGVFAALFSRGGFDDSGEATPDQLAAEKILLELIRKNPLSPIPLNALLFIRADGPDLAGSLDLARKLCQMSPEYAPCYHMLGHYEWRSGRHAEAASAFGRASSFFQRWMKDNKTTVDDCPEWAKAECYRIVALVTKGDFETAYAAARQVAATPLSTKRPSSPGNRYLLWDAKTLPARILIHRGLKGNASEGANALPKPNDVQLYHKHSLAYWWIDGLRFALEAQRLIDAEKFDEARDVVAALTHHGEAMAATQAAASTGGERSAWIQGFRALEVLASDVRGHLAMAGPADNRETAYNWFASAADRQHPAPWLCPPMILTPMASRLGDFFLATGKHPEAIEAYQRALVSFPNDMNSLVGLKKAFIAAGKPQDAEAIEMQISNLKKD